MALSAFPDRETALSAARSLVEERLVACVNLLPGALSIYRWKGAIEEAGETVVLMKTTVAVRDQLEARFKELHPYETPELLFFSPEGGLPAYLRWVEECVG